MQNSFCRKESAALFRLIVIILLTAALPWRALATNPGQANTQTPSLATDSNETKKVILYNYQKAWAVGLQAGLPGAGVEVAYNINQRFNARLRSTYFALNDYQIKYKISDQPVSVGLQADLLAFDFLLEYLPHTGSSFKLVAGDTYLNSLGASTTIMLDENTQFGDIELKPDQVGKITLTNQSSVLAAYGALGFGRAVPKRRVGVGFEIGSYYLPKPNISLDATGLLKPNASAEQEKKLEEAFSSFRWLPHMMLKIAVRIN